MIFNIDIDNTVNDFIQTFIVYINRLSGRNIQYDDITFYDLTNLGYDRKTLETMFSSVKVFKTITECYMG